MTLESESRLSESDLPESPPAETDPEPKSKSKSEQKDMEKTGKRNACNIHHDNHVKLHVT